jgi:hypothetical protein
VCVRVRAFIGVSVCVCRKKKMISMVGVNRARLTTD